MGRLMAHLRFLALVGCILMHRAVNQTVAWHSGGLAQWPGTVALMICSLLPEPAG